MLQRIVLLSTLSLCLIACASVDETLLYDIDFEPPYNREGSLLQLDDGPIPRHGVSEIKSNGSTIVSSTAGWRGHAGMMENGPGTPGRSTYAQYEFDIDGIEDVLPGSDFGTYRVTFDLMIIEFGIEEHDFTILFDTPTVRNVYFRSNGSVRAWTGHNSQSSPNVFDIGEWFGVRIDTDLVGQTVSVWVDGSPEITDLPLNATELDEIRFSLGGGDGPRSTAAIDNIQIWGIPTTEEPAN